MPLTNRLTELIAGRELADRDQRKQLERKYKDTRENVQIAEGVYFEGIPVDLNARPKREPLPPYFPKEGRIARYLPETVGSDPEISPAVLRTFRSTKGAPDISAADLSEEQLRRTYSSDNVWNHEFKLPPLPELKGFGRYRKFAGADAEWQKHHLKRNLSNLPDKIAEKIGELDIMGVEPEIWQQYRADSQRSNSFTSADSSGSGPGAPSSEVDSRTGTLISRGFSPSNVSSTASSLRGSAFHHRKDSALSVKSSGSDSSRRVPSTSSPSALSASIARSRSRVLKEKTARAFEQEKRKVQRPCEFDESGHNDNAVASEDENEWEDTLGTIEIDRGTEPPEHQFQAETHDFEALAEPRPQANEQLKLRAGNKALDRAKTVKVTRPQLRRAQSSKSRKAICKDRIVTRSENEVQGPGVATKSETRAVGRKRNGSDESELGLFMPPVERTSSESVVRPEDDWNVDDNASIGSVSTVSTLVPRPIPISQNAPLHGRRHRSGTAFRITSTELKCNPIEKIGEDIPARCGGTDATMEGQQRP